MDFENGHEKNLHKIEEPNEIDNQRKDKMKLRSLKNETEVYVKIYNLTNASVDVIWINYRGAEVIYKTLEGPGDSFQVKTFETHPWVFRASKSKKNLAVIEGDSKGYPKKIFMPRAPANRHNGKIVIITYPIESLRDMCFLALKRSGLSKDHVQSLDIPTTLKTQLKIFFERCLAH